MKDQDHQHFKVSGKGICFAFEPAFIERLLRKDRQATDEFFTVIYQLLDAFRTQFLSIEPRWGDADFDKFHINFIDRLMRILGNSSDYEIRDFNALCGKQLGYSIRNAYRFMMAKGRDPRKEVSGNASLQLDENTLCEMFDVIATEIVTVPKRAGGKSPLRIEASVYELYSAHEKFLESIDKADKVQRVREILASIESDLDRRLLILWMNRVPGKEISAITGLKEGTAASIIHRTIEDLRKRFCKKIW